jgi:hypothetical protein
MKSYTLNIILALSFLGLTACEDVLEENIYSELAPSTLFTTEDGISSVINASYAYAHRSGLVQTWSKYFMSGMPSGELWGAGGSIESLWASLSNFTWDSNHGQIVSIWNVYFSAIRDANIVLDNIDNDAFSNEFKQLTVAEMNFIRGWAYSELYGLFGPLPLYVSTSDDPLQPRASDADTRIFIEQELNAAIAGLPDEPAAYGRASKGAAMGVLSKYYLNTKQWQEAADLTEDIIQLNKYGLVPAYIDVFAIANEGNEEMLWALTKDPTTGSASQSMNALTFPPDFPRPYPNNSVWAARTYLFDAFVNSYEATDTRKGIIITDYISSSSGLLVEGLGNDQSFPYKVEFDPNSIGVLSGNDMPVIRYADILLSRAEALNELSGPTQEIIDLINEVRLRAMASTLSLGGFTKESLRDAILQERAWEFFFEAKRREDLIRQDRFISEAVARGKNAQAFHVLFPIPQYDIDANSLLVQNTGY